MIEPWFDPMRWGWLPGTLLGVIGGLWGALLGTFAPRGKHKAAVLGVGFALIAVSVACLIGGAVGWSTGQPYGVWYGLGLAGFVGTCVLSSLLPVALMRYREAEGRKMQGRDLAG